MNDWERLKNPLLTKPLPPSNTKENPVMTATTTTNNFTFVGEHKLAELHKKLESLPFIEATLGSFQLAVNNLVSFDTEYDLLPSGHWPTQVAQIDLLMEQYSIVAAGVEALLPLVRINETLGLEVA